MLTLYENKLQQDVLLEALNNFHPNIKLTIEVNLSKIYKVISSSGETYIGEIIRNVEERWLEHNSADNKSKPAKYLADNLDYSFLWSVLLAAPKDGRTCKNLQAFLIVKLKSSINRQEDSNMLTLFRNVLHSCHYSFVEQKLTLSQQ